MRNTPDCVRAIIWDYDCTLADTWKKNLSVTKKIIRTVSGQDILSIPALSSVENYVTASTRTMNWREFYVKECGLTKEQTDTAGWLWADVQLQDTTPVTFFDGIAEVLAALEDIPHGVVSQNSKRRIETSLQEGNLLTHFDCIVGYEEVDFAKQKPAPEGLLLCIERLVGTHPGYVFYIGDHEVDAECAFHTNQALQQKNSPIRVISIGAFYGNQGEVTRWQIQPDYRATSTQNIVNIVRNFQKKVNDGEE